MDRRIVYIGAIPQDIDVLQSNLDPYIAVSKLADAVLGKTQILNNFLCVPTSPATMTVNVGFGEIYSLQQVDTSAYGSITTNSNQIVKQGVTFNTTNLSCPAPVTIGYSVNYLVQITFNEQDTSSVVLPYYNSADINNPLSGPGGSGDAQNTIRQDGVTVSVKTGIAAPTGTQTTPSPDSGYTGAYVVTVAYGQTTIISGNISVYSAASFINETLTQKVSIPTGDLRWAQIARVQSGFYWFGADTGTPNSVVTSLSPAISGYSQGNIFHVLIANKNTGASTINVNSLGALNIKLTNGDAINAGDLVIGMLAEFEYDGTNVQLLNPASWASQNQVQSGTLIYAASTSSPNTYTATLSPAPSSYTTGLKVNIKITNANTGASTLNLNSLGAKNILYCNGGTINAGDLASGMIASLTYDGTQFQLSNPSIVNNSGVVGSVCNLTSIVSTASATKTVTIDEIDLATSLGGFHILLSNLSLSSNLAATGANGMDTGSAPVSGYVAEYVIYNPSTATTALLYQDVTSSVATNVYSGGHMPSGYTYSALTSVWPTNGAGVFLAASQYGRDLCFADILVLSTTSVINTPTSLSISSAVPKNAKKVGGRFSSTNNSANGGIIFSVSSSSTQFGLQNFSVTNPIAASGLACAYGPIQLITSQTVYYETFPNASGTVSLSVYVTNYSI